MTVEPGGVRRNANLHKLLPQIHLGGKVGGLGQHNVRGTATSRVVICVTDQKSIKAIAFHISGGAGLQSPPPCVGNGAVDDKAVTPIAAVGGQELV